MGKDPFGPEEKTTPSVRNPILEQPPKRESVEVVEVDAPSATSKRPKAVIAAERPTAPPPPPPFPRPTDDAAGPSTPRPQLSPDAIPRVVADAAFIRLLPLEPRDAFLLTRIDGASDLRALLDVTGMSRLEVFRVLEKLVDLGVVELS